MMTLSIHKYVKNVLYKYGVQYYQDSVATNYNVGNPRLSSLEDFSVGSFFFIMLSLIGGTTLVQNSKIIKEGKVGHG
jgi:hypothetical protein